MVDQDKPQKVKKFLKWWVPGCFVCNGLYPDQTFLASVILLPYNVLLLIGLASVLVKLLMKWDRSCC